MRNKYPGLCLRCNCHVAPNTGYFQRVNGKWCVRCKGCVGKGNTPIWLEESKKTASQNK